MPKAHPPEFYDRLRRRVFGECPSCGSISPFHDGVLTKPRHEIPEDNRCADRWHFVMQDGEAEWRESDPTPSASREREGTTAQCPRCGSRGRHRYGAKCLEIDYVPGHTDPPPAQAEREGTERAETCVICGHHARDHFDKEHPASDHEPDLFRPAPPERVGEDEEAQADTKWEVGGMHDADYPGRWIRRNGTKVGEVISDEIGRELLAALRDPAQSSPTEAMQEAIARADELADDIEKWHWIHSPRLRGAASAYRSARALEGKG